MKVFSITLLLLFGVINITTSQCSYQLDFHSPLHTSEIYEGTPEEMVPIVLSDTLDSTSFPISMREGFNLVRAEKCRNYSKGLKRRLDSLVEHLALLPKDTVIDTLNIYKGLYAFSKIWDWDFRFVLERERECVTSIAEEIYDKNMLKRSVNRQRCTFSYDQTYLMVIDVHERWGNSSTIYLNVSYYKKVGSP